jgi:hypothetical protein
LLKRRCRWSRCGAILVIAGLLGCGEATGVVADVSMRTDANSYVATVVASNALVTQYSFEVVVRTENRSPSPVQLHRCFSSDVRPIYDIVLVDASAGARSAYMTAWGCPASPSPLILPAGAARSDTLRFLGATQPNGPAGAPVDALEGQMRITFASSPRQLQSNTFTVSRAP